jgi:hypothetical protein
MTPKCPFCSSKSVRYDRALAGRPVCGSCGMPLNQGRSGNRRRRSIISGVRSSRSGVGVRFLSRTLIAWLLPTGLVVSYIALAFNPNAIKSYRLPGLQEATAGWNIATPADVELLIQKAQIESGREIDARSEAAIRDITATLRNKNVRLLISDNVTPEAGGVWDPNYGEIRLRPSTVAFGTQTLAAALAHESAHVAQSCNAGGIHQPSKPMGIKVDTAKTYQRQLGSTLYAGPPSSKAVELEAYSVGAIPDWAPKLLQHYCK